MVPTGIACPTGGKVVSPSAHLQGRKEPLPSFAEYFNASLVAQCLWDLWGEHSCVKAAMSMRYRREACNAMTAIILT